MRCSRSNAHRFTIPTLARFLLLLALTAAPRVVTAQALDESAGTRRICEAGPSAKVARAQRLAGAARVVAADVLPNPALVVEHQRALSGATENETVVGVSVPLGIGGRRSLLQDAAAARSEQASFEGDATLFENALAFREAYAHAVLDQARIAALEQQQQLLDALSGTIGDLAKGGEAAQYDLLRQRVHAQLHQRTLAFAKARASASLAFLEAWLGTKVAFPPIALFDLAGGARGDARPVDAPSMAHAELRRLDAEARASALEARAARRRWVPELELFAGYRTTTITSDTGHGIALSLRAPLTFFDHGQGDAALARADQRRALATAESLRLQYSARLQSVDAQLRELLASAAQLEATSSDAVTLRDKARLLYAAGESTLTELLDAYRTAEEAGLGLIDLAEEIAMTRLARMRAAGTQLDAGLDEACNVTQGSSP